MLKAAGAGKGSVFRSPPPDPIFLFYRKDHILVNRFFPKGFFINKGSHIYIMTHIVFCDHSNLCLIFCMIFFQSNVIPYLKIQKFCCFFTDHSAFVCQFISLPGNPVPQSHILTESFHILRNIEINADV